MVNWIRGIDLMWAFVILLAFHGMLYYVQQTPNWYFVAFIASLVDTAVLALAQFLLRGRSKAK